MFDDLNHGCWLPAFQEKSVLCPLAKLKVREFTDAEVPFMLWKGFKLQKLGQKEHFLKVSQKLLIFIGVTFHVVIFQNLMTTDVIAAM